MSWPPPLIACHERCRPVPRPPHVPLFWKQSCALPLLAWRPAFKVVMHSSHPSISRQLCQPSPLVACQPACRPIPLPLHRVSSFLDLQLCLARMHRVDKCLGLLITQCLAKSCQPQSLLACGPPVLATGLATISLNVSSRRMSRLLHRLVCW